MQWGAFLEALKSDEMKEALKSFYVSVCGHLVRALNASCRDPVKTCASLALQLSPAPQVKARLLCYSLPWSAQEQPAQRREHYQLCHQLPWTATRLLTPASLPLLAWVASSMIAVGISVDKKA